MTGRLIIESVEPSAIKTLMQLEKYMETVSIPGKSVLLMKIRASQINGCHYCIGLHSKHALLSGETQERIDRLADWREEQNTFNAEEQLLLGITEEITLINQHGLSDELYAKGENIFGEKGLAQIIMIVIIINSWNRLAISLKTKWKD